MMHWRRDVGILTVACLLIAGVASSVSAGGLKPLRYNHPGLVVDLGVGLWAWPLPMDYDGDGDNDLVVSCPDKPYNGTYFFENVDGDKKLPVFKPAVRIGPGHGNIQVSHVGSQPRVLVPGREFLDFAKQRFEQPHDLPVSTKVHETSGRIRANQWKYVDYEGDGDLDLIVGVGDWTDYGWDDAYNEQGQWTRGPLRGFVYLVKNQGTADAPDYAAPEKVLSGKRPVEVFGWPTPNFADFDGDGDLDLICGEFLDRLTWFENTGTRSAPTYASGRLLKYDGQLIRMDLQMIVPAAIDWDNDGDVDLVVGDEDGRVALIEHTGELANAMPAFLPPKYFQQQADLVKFGALATPVGFDWDSDGDADIVCGNTAGYIGLIENLGGGTEPKWAAPRLLEAEGKIIRIQAGENGSIQGPCEAKWGYTTLSVADWDHDGLADLIVNSIWGEIVWFRNDGSRGEPVLQETRPIEVQWRGQPPKPSWVWWKPVGKQLVTQWRTTPVVVDFNNDGLNDLLVLDHEGYLAFFERRRENGVLELLPGKRVFIDEETRPIRLNPRSAGKSGRKKLHAVDWDGDGRLDLLMNSVNADLLRNVETRGSKTVLKNLGPLDETKLAGHTSSPTTVDWNKDGIRELLIGAEDGHLYYAPREK